MAFRLRTGHPGYARERDVIRNYNIADYRNTSAVTRPSPIATLDSILGHTREAESDTGGMP